MEDQFQDLEMIVMIEVFSRLRECLNSEGFRAFVKDEKNKGFPREQKTLQRADLGN